MRTSTRTNRNLFFVFGTFASITLILLTPAIFKISAAQDKTSRPNSNRYGFPDFDIRKDKKSADKIVEFRNRNGKNASEIAIIRESFGKGVDRLKAKMRNLKVEYNDDLKIPETIGTDVLQGRNLLTPASQEGRAGILHRFLRENDELTGIRSEKETGQLKVSSDYKNPENGLGMVELIQDLNGIRVFRGSVKAGFTKDNRIIRVINNFAPGLDDRNVPADFGDPKDAFAAAANSIGHTIDAGESVINNPKLNPNKVSFGVGDFAPTAEKIYFPTEPGVAVPAWRVLIWEPIDAYNVIVDAQTGTLLWRKNISDSQTQSASYNVYANPNAMVNIADNPFPMTPGPTSPNGVQGSPISRTLIDRVGNEAPYTFNNLGWITDGNNTTDGNNVEAGLDRESPNGNSPGIDPNGKASGSPNRVFDFPFNPGIPSNPVLNTGDSPLPAGQTPGTCQAQGTATAPTDFQKAVVTQLFYIANWYHDETYRLGFTEAAGNFQNSNFGRGGSEGDRVSAEAQDCSSTNNAGFASPPDGSRGRMQMYIWTAPSPDFDGSLDADVVIHELTHGLSNRLHGNSAGLSGMNMSRAMGEGWSDFYAHSMLSEPTDPINGIYPTGGYATYRMNSAPNSLNNYYYGIRRFPKAVMAFTGENGKPHNPLTFNDIDTSKINLTDGAFPPAFNTTADGVHAAGEVWSSALWEIRARYVARLGWAVGNRRILQHVTDGMKLAPLNPTFLQERDAILAGALANGEPEDVADIWAGFAIRGMGASASIQNTGGFDTFGSGTGQTRVTEAFDLPNLQQVPDITISDSTGDNDGVFEPGEIVQITVPVRNQTGSQADNVNVQIVGGGSAFYGTIANNASASNQINYTIPSGTPCGAAITITINVTSSLGTTSFQRTIAIGMPVQTFSENFDSVQAPSIPIGWTAVPVAGGINFLTATSNPDSSPNAVYAANSATVSGGTDLTTPSIPIAVSAALVSFRNRYVTEAGWDGGVLEISINGGSFQDILAAGGVFVQNGYNNLMAAADSSGSYIANPLNGRNGWTGNSGGYVTTTVRLPAAAAGQNVQFKFRFGQDNDTAAAGQNPGWYIDNVQVFGQATCSFAPTAVSVGGRVVDPSGRGIAKAYVTLTDGVNTQIVITNSFGYFTFPVVVTGTQYTVAPSSKRYSFSSQIVTPLANVTNLNFVGT